MSGETQVFRIPYMTGSDRPRDLPNLTRQAAERIETALVSKGGTPLGSDLASIISRLNALERNQLKNVPGLSGLNGYALEGGSRLYAAGDLVFLIVNARRAAGATAVEVASIPAAYAPPASVTFTGTASQGGAAQPVTLVAGTNGRIRSWTTASPNTLVSFNIFWKRGA